MPGPLLLPALSRIAELPEFLRRVEAVGAWAPGGARSWEARVPGNAPTRSLVGHLAARGERVTPVGGGEGPILSLDDAEPIARRIGERAASLHPGLSTALLRGMRFAAEELVANVAQHARAGASGFASVDLDAGGVTLWVSDCGVGIEASLRGNPEFEGRITDPAGAIALALQRGVTGAPGKGNMGIGLPFVVDLCQAAGGEVAIVSGAALWRRRVGAGGAFPSFVESVSAWLGTIVALRIPGPGAARV